MQNPCRHHPLLVKLQWLQCIWCHRHHLPGYLMLAAMEKGSSLWMMKRRARARLLYLHSGWLDRLNPRCQLAGRTTWRLCWVFLGNSIVMSHDGCVSELTGLSCCKYGKPCNKTIQGLHPAGLMPWSPCALCFVYTVWSKATAFHHYIYLCYSSLAPPRYLQGPQMRSLVDTHIHVLKREGFDRMYPWCNDT